MALLSFLSFLSVQQIFMGLLPVFYPKLSANFSDCYSQASCSPKSFTEYRLNCKRNPEQYRENFSGRIPRNYSQKFRKKLRKNLELILEETHKETLEFEGGMDCFSIVESNLLVVSWSPHAITSTLHIKYDILCEVLYKYRSTSTHEVPSSRKIHFQCFI